MYYKYHGCGNDFIIGFWKDNINYEKFALKVCNRFTGVGADGVILAKKNFNNFEMVFYNADGSRAPMCGNGIRCLVAFLNDQKLVENNVIEIQTLSGNRMVNIINGLFEVNMGEPCYDAELLEIETSKKEFINEKISFKNTIYNVYGVYMTTHHLVVKMNNDIDLYEINDDIGKYLCTNQLFKKGINVNFVQIIDQKNIKVRTYERGVGWTKACGSGSCASFAVLNKENLIDDQVFVSLEYGKLQINKNILNKKEIIMKGPAIKICSIEIEE